MRDWRGAVLVLVILGIGLTVGAAAGYRLHVQQEWQAHGAPADARLTIDWPDASTFAANVTLAPGNATALGALQAGAALGGFDVVTSFFSDFGGDYVYAIGDHHAEGACGWMFGLDGVGREQRADRAADRVWIENGTWVAWYWDCL